MPKANRQDQKDGNATYEFSDEATKRKIRRHINDINDVITDKDINNAKVPGKEETPVTQKPSRKIREKGEKDIKAGGTPANPKSSRDVLQE